jgi:hypothetical protein
MAVTRLEVYLVSLGPAADFPQKVLDIGQFIL